MQYFQNTVDGSTWQFPDGMDLVKQRLINPDIPTTLSSTIVPMPTDGKPYLFQSGVWVLDTVAEAVLAREKLVVDASALLNQSDTVIVRCISAGVTVPMAWNIYRNDLRAIVNGTDTIVTVLPIQPAYPVGT